MATTTPRIVIIGAGVVGCALADELTRRGHGDVTVLDRDAEPGAGGSTAHAPGSVFRTTGGRMTTRLASATVTTWTGLAERGVPCLRRVGGLEVATTPERLAELGRRHGRAAAAGVEARLVDPDGCAALHPLLDRDRILGGLHVPSDGIVDAAAVARAQAASAAARGARFRWRRTVTRIDTGLDRVRAVHCDDERFDADLVLCCAGVWSPLVGALAGVALPLVPMTHQYARSTPLRPLEVVHALESAAGAADPRTPMLRHPDARLQIHGNGARLGIGSSGRPAAPLDPADLIAPGPQHPAPTHRRFTRGDFDASWEAAADLLPALSDAKIEDGADVVVGFTPDGMPLLGEHPALRGFWSASAVRVAHAAGAAEALAEWITNGRPAVGGEPIDLSAAHVGRFDPAALAPDVVRARACRAYDGACEVTHPLDPPVVARPVRTTPFHSRLDELRGEFTEVSGYERALWFGANAALPEVCEADPRRGWEARNWSPVAAAEALLTRRAAGAFDLSPSRRVEVTGPRACEFLQRLVSNDVDVPIGRVVPALLLDATGSVRTDLTVARLGSQRFLVLIPDRLDVAELCRYRRDGVAVIDVTEATAHLGLWGPRVPQLLDELVVREAGALGSWRGAEFGVGRVPVTGLRTRPIGEDGWELVCAAADAERLWDTVYAAGARYGLVAAGRRALDSLRIEAGARDRGADLTGEHGPDASGLGHLVATTKGPFLGRVAVHAARAAGPPARRLGTLVLDHAGAVLDGGEPVHDLPEARRFSREPVLLTPDMAPPGPQPVIGYVTNAAVGYTTGTSIAHAWLPAGRAVPGTRVAVGTARGRLTARVVEDPVHDDRARVASGG